MTIQISTHKLFRTLTLVAMTLIALNIAGRAYINLGGENNLIVDLLNVDHERSFPTFYSHTILLLSATLLALIAQLTYKTNKDHVGWWRALSAIFLFLALDEALVLHEHLITDSMSWTAPYGFLFLVFGFSFQRFLFNLPPQTRNQFIIAGAVYVLGAIGMEIPAGQLYEASGGSPTYVLVTTIEESLEIFGVLIFIEALLTYMHNEFGRVKLELTTAETSTVQNRSAVAID